MVMLRYLLAVPCFDQGDVGAEASPCRVREHSQSGRGVPGGKVGMNGSNGARPPKQESRWVWIPMQEEKKERRTVVIVDGDEETKIPEHQLDFVGEGLKTGFRGPARNVFGSSK